MKLIVQLLQNADQFVIIIKINTSYVPSLTLVYIFLV